LYDYLRVYRPTSHPDICCVFLCVFMKRLNGTVV
jgi:hypothetical protein